MYDIDQYTAMCLIKTAWDEVSQQTIANCWKKAGVLPGSEGNKTDESVKFVDQEAKRQLEEQIDEVEKIHPKRGHISIDDLLNPA